MSYEIRHPEGLVSPQVARTESAELDANMAFFGNKSTLKLMGTGRWRLGLLVDAFA